MRLYQFLYIISFFALTGALSAQPISTIPFQAHLEKAVEYEEQKNYASQLDELEEAYKKKRDRSLLPIIAELHYKLRDYTKAENTYKRIADLDKSGKNIEARFKYARMMKMNGKYAEAKEVFDLVEASGEEPWSSGAKLELRGIAVGLQMDSIPDVTVSSAGNKINSRSGEYSPFVFENKLFYTSTAIANNDEPGNAYPVKLLQSEKDKNLKWAEGKEVSNSLTASSPAIGNVAIASDGTMYLTKVGFDGEELDYSRLYYSVMNGSDWSDPVKVEGLPDSAIVKNPTPGELFGRDVLFFSSNAPGGKGGFDLYYATKLSEGKFDSPVNLGDVINTTGDEISPFYRDGILYFSSDGIPGIGGLDIFYTEWNGTFWSNPNNLGIPYNSTYDDMSFNVDKEGYEGFIVSNRPGTISFRGKTCCDDIFQFNITKPVIEVDIFVLDQNKPLRGGQLTIMEQFVPETKLTEGDADTYRFTYELEMSKGYFIKAERLGYFPDSLYVQTGGIDHDSTIIVKINLQPKPEVEVISTNQPIRLNNIYYDYNDHKILKDSEADLDYLNELMVKYPTMIIELSSHTDARGKDDYNMALSQRRAESAKAYLVNKGIDTARINAVGYGETVLLNQCTNDVKCTDDEHRHNRRTEFKIISGPTSIEIRKQVTKERGKVIQTKTLEEKAK